MIIIDTKYISIVQLNDVHGYLELHQELFREGNHNVYRKEGGYARISTLLNQIREEGELLVLDNGDTFHGTYPVVETKGEILVPILNALKIDGMTAHWDFAYGPDKLKDLVSELDYPLIACNIYRKDNQKRFFEPYIVKEINGLKLGIIGIASNVVGANMEPSFSEGLEFTLGKKELIELIPVLKEKENVDLVIMLSHLGFPQEMQILSEISGVDVCLSGHTHNRIFKAEHMNDTIVIQSGSHGSFIGRLDLTIKEKKVIDYKHELIEVKESIVENKEVTELIENQMEPFRDKLSTAVGETLKPLDRGEVIESTMDNLILKAIRYSTGVEIAFSNGWRYGAPVVPGPITINDLYNIVPTNPYITMLDITGREIKELIEQNIETTFSKNPYEHMGGYLKRISGIHVYLKLENPKGSKLQEIFFNNRKIEDNKTYKVAFITVQAVPEKYGTNRENSDIKMVHSLKTYLNENSPIEIGLDKSYIFV